MKNVLKQYRHIWVALYGVIYMIWFFALEARTDVTFYSVHITLDDWIPFNEYFSLFYVIWFPYVAFIFLFLFFKDAKEFYRCSLFLLGGMTISLIIYTIWPNQQCLRVDSFPRQNFCTDIVKHFYSTDTPTNVCPSIHVFNSIGVHIAILKSRYFQGKKYRIIRLISWILMIGISLSTVFIKQHSAFDGICAILLAAILYVICYRILGPKILRTRANEA